MILSNLKKLRISSVKNLVNHYPDFVSESGWRWLLFNRKENKLDRCIIKQGRRIFLNLDLVDEWLDANREVE